jgi:hypothetical protein
MSINACSINEYTINTLCGRRRRAIIDSLLPPTPVVSGGGSVQHVNPNTRLPLNMFRRDSSREEYVDIKTLEHQFIEVTVEINGVSFSETLERDDTVPLVTVYSLSASGALEESVNISDVSIKVLQQ